MPTAAVLNVGGIVLYHPFWSYPLDKWLVTKPMAISSGRFLKQVRRHRGAR